MPEGFDSKTMDMPDIVLVKKKYIAPSKRLWKLQRLDKEEEIVSIKKHARNEYKERMDEEEFLNDVVLDEEAQSKMNIYKDQAAIDEVLNKFGNLTIEKPEIPLEKLLNELDINDQNERKDSIDIIKDKETEESNQNKKQIGKRERTGKQIEDEL
jgi:hypothetical protein